MYTRPKRTCPFCGTIRNKLWGHIRLKHPDLGMTDKEILVKIKGWKEVPICANPRCNNQVLMYKQIYQFGQYCSARCKTAHIAIKLWQNPEFRERKSAQSAEVMRKMARDKWDNDPNYREMQSQKMHNLMVDKWTNDEDWIKSHSERAKQRMRDQAKTKRSGYESRFCDRIRNIFVDFKVENNLQIGKFYPDIVILDLKLIIEVDGYTHDSTIDYDLDRDKFLYSQGYKVRRLECHLCDKLTNDQITQLVIKESNETIPYYERVGRNDLLLWKTNILI